MQKLVLGFLVTFAMCLQSNAQDYPTRPIRLLVGSPAGSTSDIIARSLAQQLSTSLGQPVVVENKPQAAGLTTGKELAHSAPDGYTLMLASKTVLVNANFYDKPLYDARDILPIAFISVSPLVLVSNINIPARSADELIALSRQKQHPLSCASAGKETVSHLATELFNQRTSAALRHVPYHGSGAAVADLLAGSVDTAFLPVGSVASALSSGKLRALAVTGTARSPSLPEVPTLIEAGIANFQSTDWNILIASAGTPSSIISKIRTHSLQSLASLSDRFRSLGVELPTEQNLEIETVIRNENESLRRLISVCTKCCCGQTCGGLCLE